MAHNPFDDFADDFRSALPGQQIPGGNPPPPPEAVVHPSTTGSATQSVQLPHFSGHPIPNGNTNGSGIPSNMGMNATAPPHQQQPVIGGPGAPSTGMYFPPQTHQMQPPQPSSALVPSSEGTTPNPYASMLGPPTDQHSQGMASQMSAQDTSSVIQPSPALQGAGNSNPFQAIPSATGPPPAPVAPTGLPVDSSNPFAAPSGPGLVPMPPPSGQVPPAFHDSMSSPSAGLGPTGGANYGVSPGAQSDIQQLPSQHPTSVALNGTGHFDPIAMPTGPPAAVDPFGAAGTQPSAGGNAGALVVASQPVDDPFGVFAAPAVPAQTPVPADTTPPPASDDPWADMGFGPPVPDADTGKSKDGLPTSVSAGEIATGVTPNSSTKAPSRSPGELPPGGEWYDARIFTPTLGVMFFKPQELTDSLFLQTDKALVDALDDRPVVAFIVEGSSARSAGVELGHVLLKVNGIDVKNPKEASRLIKEGPRPLPLLFYVPDTTVVVAEGEHMVKYDTRETGAPNSAKDWKPKYVVIGGIIAQPWMMNMYRSKSEYDIAVIETQARRPVSVKVKQFSLQGARIQNDWQGPQMVKYKNKLHPWKYIVVLPVSRNPIKISSPNLSQLKPVHEGIRRVLMAQQRDRGHPSPHTAAPVRQADPYLRNGNGQDFRSNERNAYQDGGMGSVRRQNQ